MVFTPSVIHRKIIMKESSGQLPAAKEMLVGRLLLCLS